VHDVVESPVITAHEPRHLRSGRSRALRIALAIVLAPVTLLVVVTIAWAIDTSTRGGEVVRNIELAGRPVGGLAEEELPEAVARAADDASEREVRIVTPDATYETRAADIGLSLDVDRTAEGVLDMGRTEAFPLRPVHWLGSFLEPRSAPMRFQTNAVTVREKVIELEGDARTPPVEPSIRAEEGGFAVVPGKSGVGIDADDVARLLRDQASVSSSGAIVIEIAPGEIEPRFSDDDAATLAREAGELTDAPLRVDAGGRSGEISAELLRSWVRVVPGDEALSLQLDPAAVSKDLVGVVTGYPDAPQNARFVVEGGVPAIIASQPGTVCCDDQSPGRIMSALQTGAAAVTLDVTTGQPALTTDAARGLGITEEIGSPTAFGPTTEHACCESRVTNIHRIADIIRGAVIMPGETFSVNAFVGQRTTEKGFVSGGAIVNGVVDSQIGGGVSQFATTFFNAALYAGLEFGEYQSHSLYISRYPRGHEATISWEHPDLQIKNPTPHAVLVWPTYTETSITVHLYSTRYFTEVTVGEPTSAPSGRCTRWTTPRTRVTPEGEVLRDTVAARYRPAEGVSC
jgi:vancomycin resistance protein YoaR